MSAQFDSTPGLHLPPPSLGGTQAPMQPVAQVSPQAQQAMFSHQQPVVQPQNQDYQQQALPQQPILQQPTAMPAQPMASPAAQALPIEQLQQQPELQAASQTTMMQPIVADNEKDGDALDEEWIAKTKALIEQYKNDPYALSNALSALKADYLKVRHGITAKVDGKA